MSDNIVIIQDDDDNTVSVYEGVAPNATSETADTIKSKLGITTLSGSNTGDQDLSTYATIASVTPKADTTYVDTQDTAIQSQVTTGLAGKANTSHVHPISDVTSLQTALDGKQATGDYATNTTVTNGLATKEPTITAGTTAQYYRGDKTFQTLDKTAVGLGNVENTSDVDKPVSTAQQTAINSKQDVVTMPQFSVPVRDGSVAGSGPANAYRSYSIASVINSIPVRGADGSILSASFGSSTAYASNLYAQTHFFNATASISGTVAGEIRASAANMYHNGLSGTDTNLYIVQPSTAAASLTLQSSNGQFNSVIGQSGTFRTFTFGTFGSANGLYFQTNNASGTGYGTATALKLDFSQNASFANQVMIGSTSINPTHTLTLPSTGTGIALYNTSDQTTNYERTLLRYESNVFVIRPERGGTGSVRTLSLQVGDIPRLNLTNGGGTTGYIQLTSNFSINTISPIASVEATLTGSNNINYGLSVKPTINQTGTAGYTTLLINPTETAVGSGAKFLGDFQVGGVRKASIDNTGAIMVTGFDAALATKTANYTLIVSDYTILFDATAGNLVATLPTAASSTGRVYNIKKMDSTANTVTIDANASETIDGALTKVISTQFNSYTIQSTGTAWVVI